MAFWSSSGDGYGSLASGMVTMVFGCSCYSCVVSAPTTRSLFVVDAKDHSACSATEEDEAEDGADVWLTSSLMLAFPW